MTFSNGLRGFITCLTVILIGMWVPSSTVGQTRRYTDQTLQYALDLPSPDWNIISGVGITGESTEFSYGKGLVLLRVRRELKDADVSTAEVVQRQQQFDRVSLAGYVKGEIESFAGRLSGTRYPYEYISAGKRVRKITYYLQANNRVIYRIEFTGPAEELSDVTNDIEFIARSFRLK